MGQVVLGMQLSKIKLHLLRLLSQLIPRTINHKLNRDKAVWTKTSFLRSMEVLISNPRLSLNKDLQLVGLLLHKLIKIQLLSILNLLKRAELNNFLPQL